MFCSKCGNNLGEGEFPKHCEACGTSHYKNPIPVVVCLLPAVDRREVAARAGVLLVRRTLGRTAGKYALPGGFIDLKDESWQAAASREVKEETGFDVPPDRWKAFDLGTASDRNLLVFVAAENFAVSWDGQAPPVNGETDELRVVYEPVELVFPMHTAALRRFFTEATVGQTQRST